MVWCGKTIKLANNQRERKLQSAVSESKETERWQGQDRKNRLFKMTETQVRLQIYMSTYIYCALVRYQIKEKKCREQNREKLSLQRNMEHEKGGGGKGV